MATTARGEEDAIVAQATSTVGRLTENIATVVEGKDDQIRLVLAALACQGHVLLEDVPGTAKTVLARALAGSVEGTTVSRIQCTPGPAADRHHRALGLESEHARVRVPRRAGLRERPPRRRDQPGAAEGPVRAPRRHGGVPGDGRRGQPSAPESVLRIATENTIEQDGTFPLPEAQLDRFLVRTSLGYPRWTKS